MAKTNPNASLLIDDYIESLPVFSYEICWLLRETIHNSKKTIVEDWKWKTPIFYNENEMICGFAAFKKHVSLTFFNGAQMNDQHKLFSEDCSGQKTRTIKFNSLSEINQQSLLAYLKEAFLLKKVPNTSISKKTTFEIPILLQAALKNNLLAKTNFENMAYTYQKEYALHISQAKREATKISRLKKVITNLEQNIKMHEQYGKC